MPKPKPSPMGDFLTRIIGLAILLPAFSVLGFVLTHRTFSADQVSSYLAYKSTTFLPRPMVLIASLVAFVGVVFVVAGRRFDEFLMTRRGFPDTRRKWATSGLGLAFSLLIMLLFQYVLGWPGYRPPPPSPVPSSAEFLKKFEAPELPVPRGER
jgi:hypothetical protein